MAPKTPIVFATLFEKQAGTDGNMYSAEIDNGKMGWKPCSGSQTNRSTDVGSRRAQNAYDTCQRNGVEYIAENKGGSLEWVPNDFKRNAKNTTITFAVLPKGR
jgi:hypothetical protein